MAGVDALLIGPQHQGGRQAGYLVTTCSQSMAAASGAIFTVTGVIKMRNLVGSVSTVIATTTSLQIAAGATTLTASTTITTNTTLTLLLRETALASALTEIASNTGSLHADPTPIILGSPGSVTTISGTLDASGTGVIDWALEWVPLSPNAKVVAAQ